jgi:drug/metabolite transporter (DMT)-like permease
MKDSLFAILALISAVVAGYFFYSFQNQGDEGSSMSLILGVLFALVAVGLGAYYMFNKVNRHEDIHITE